MARAFGWIGEIFSRPGPRPDLLTQRFTWLKRSAGHSAYGELSHGFSGAWPVGLGASESVVFLMDSKRTLRVRRILLSGLVLLMLLASPVQAASYAPLFSQDILSKLDPATRERFVALEDENHRRWLNRNPQQRDVGAAERQHLETEAMLARFAETRRLGELSRQRDTDGQQAQQQRCQAAAADIALLSTGGRIYVTQEDGERRYLSDKELSERVKAKQKSYKKHC